MDPVVFATILLRVLAVYIAAEGITSVAEIVSVWSIPTARREDLPVTWIVVFALVMSGGFGALVWGISPYLAQKMVARFEPITNTTINVKSMQGAILSIAGLLLFFTSLPSIISLSIRAASSEAEASLSAISGLVAQLVKAGLGAYLVLGTASLVAFINRFREFGLEEKTSNE